MKKLKDLLTKVDLHSKEECSFEVLNEETSAKLAAYGGRQASPNGTCSGNSGCAGNGSCAGNANCQQNSVCEGKSNSMCVPN